MLPSRSEGSSGRRGVLERGTSGRPWKRLGVSPGNRSANGFPVGADSPDSWLMNWWGDAPIRALNRIAPRAAGRSALIVAAVLTLKFRSGRYLAPLMGEFLRDALERRPVQADVIVPVPLVPGRLRRRGFNQAALLAEQVSIAVGGTLVEDALEREERPAQQTLRAVERLVGISVVSPVLP